MANPRFPSVFARNFDPPPLPPGSPRATDATPASPSPARPQPLPVNEDEANLLDRCKRIADHLKLHKRPGSPVHDSPLVPVTKPVAVATTRSDRKLLRNLSDMSAARVDLMLRKKQDGRTEALVVKLIKDAERGKREMEQARLKCSHPNVVKYFRAEKDSDSGNVTLEMEFLDLGSLREVMQKWPTPEQMQRRESKNMSSSSVASASSNNMLSREPSMEERISIARSIAFQTLHGLLYYHVVQQRWHRDIKPDNILLSVEGRVKLSDFDASKEAAESSNPTLIGTETYMAPECIDFKRDKGRNSDKCDVWSLGVVVAELTLGRHPFRGLSIIQFGKPGPHIAALPLHELPDADLRDFIRRCLTEDPEERISVCDALCHPFFHRGRRSMPSSMMSSAEQQLAAANRRSKSDVDAERKVRQMGIPIQGPDLWSLCCPKVSSLIGSSAKTSSNAAAANQVPPSSPLDAIEVQSEGTATEPSSPANTVAAALAAVLLSLQASRVSWRRGETSDIATCLRAKLVEGKDRRQRSRSSVIFPLKATIKLVGIRPRWPCRSSTV